MSVVSITQEALNHFGHVNITSFFITLQKVGCAGYSFIIKEDIPTVNYTVESHGGVLVYIDNTHVNTIDGTSIDVKDGFLGRVVIFNNTKYSKCGCGETFEMRK